MQISTPSHTSTEAHYTAEDTSSGSPLHSLCDRCKSAFQRIQDFPRSSDDFSGIHARYVSSDESRPPFEKKGENLSILLHPSLSHFMESLSSRCHFCTIVKEYLSKDAPDDDSGVEIEFRRFIPQINLALPRVYSAYEFTRCHIHKEPVFEDPDLLNHGYVSGFQGASHTSSETHRALSRHWINECRTKHVQCKPRNVQDGFLPTRLIKLDHNCPDTIWLYLTAGQHVGVEYTTLSHCWGGATDIPQLTSHSAKDLENGIATGELPRNFRDAVSITKSLGLEYLWIDSLCIMQDSAEDWRKEASRMAAVYENSYVTIAAAAGPDPHYGCYSGRDALLQSVCHVPSDDPVKDLYIVPPWNAARNKPALVDKSVLLTRGWVFQEMTLSPRVLLFCKDGLAWSCRTGDASEAVPAGTTPPYALDGRSMSINSPHSSSLYHNKQQQQHESAVFIPGRRLFAAVLQASEKLADARDARPAREFSELWLSVVRQYTELNLTFGKDRLVAISAIAQRVKEHVGLTYLAGLWAETLAHDLLWITKDPEGTLRPEAYQAPSWSWGALKGPVSNDRWGNGDYKGPNLGCWISDMRPQVRWHVDDTAGTGQVLEGSRLSFDCYLHPCSHVGNRQRDSFGRTSWELRAVEQGGRDDGFPAWFLPDVGSEVQALDYRNVRILPVLSSDMVSFKGEINFWGLVVVSHGSHFTRVGTWSTRTRPDRFNAFKSSIMLL